MNVTSIPDLSIKGSGTFTPARNDLEQIQSRINQLTPGSQERIDMQGMLDELVDLRGRA